MKIKHDYFILLQYMEQSMRKYPYLPPFLPSLFLASLPLFLVPLSSSFPSSPLAMTDGSFLMWRRLSILRKIISLQPRKRHCCQAFPNVWPWLEEEKTNLVRDSRTCVHRSQGEDLVSQDRFERPIGVQRIEMNWSHRNRFRTPRLFLTTITECVFWTECIHDIVGHICNTPWHSKFANYRNVSDMEIRLIISDNHLRYERSD